MTSCFTHRLRRWEAALLLAFGITLTLGVWASASESALAEIGRASCRERV